MHLSNSRAPLLSQQQLPLLLLGGFLFIGCGSKPAVQQGKLSAASVATQQASTTREPRVMRASYDELPLNAAAFPEPSEQELAGQALGRIGKPAVPQLVNALRHRDPSVRRQAASVLAKIGPDARAAAPMLTAALDDEDLAVRKAASRALGEIGPAAEGAVPALMRTLVQPNPNVPGAADPLRK